jgi:hypothetical protein
VHEHRRSERTGFSEADLTKDLRSLRDDPDARQDALKHLCLINAIRVLPTPKQSPHKRGRKPSKAYEVNPQLYEPEQSGNGQAHEPSIEKQDFQQTPALPADEDEEVPF